MLRAALRRLAQYIGQQLVSHRFRVLVDSAPVLEKALARNAGLGWIGKHTNVINSRAGSWFFLGEIYTDLPLPVDVPATDHCGAVDTPYTVEHCRLTEGRPEVDELFYTDRVKRSLERRGKPKKTS